LNGEAAEISKLAVKASYTTNPNALERNKAFELLIKSMSDPEDTFCFQYASEALIYLEEHGADITTLQCLTGAYHMARLISKAYYLADDVNGPLAIINDSDREDLEDWRDLGKLALAFRRSYTTPPTIFYVDSYIPRMDAATDYYHLHRDDTDNEAYHIICGVLSLVLPAEMYQYPFSPTPKTDKVNLAAEVAKVATKSAQERKPGYTTPPSAIKLQTILRDATLSSKPLPHLLPFWNSRHFAMLDLFISLVAGNGNFV
jgi:hypothetical protein